MAEEIKYVDKASLEYTIDKIKEHVANNYMTKSELEGIHSILDNINGEVV